MHILNTKNVYRMYFLQESVKGLNQLLIATFLKCPVCFLMYFKVENIVFYILEIILLHRFHKNASNV